MFHLAMPMNSHGFDDGYYFEFQALFFMNFNGEGAESLKSKYREVAASNKGHGLSFLLGDAENSQEALQV